MFSFLSDVLIFQRKTLSSYNLYLVITGKLGCSITRYSVNNIYITYVFQLTKSCLDANSCINKVMCDLQSVFKNMIIQHHATCSWHMYISALQITVKVTI